MQFSVFKIFAVFGLVSTWATKALADGKVTLTEAIELVTALCSILGIVPELDVPGVQIQQLTETQPTEELIANTSNRTRG